MPMLGYILMIAAALAGIGLGLLLVGLRILKVLRELKVQQTVQAADATQALVKKLDELHSVESLLARATKLAESAQAIVDGNHPKEVVRASMLLVQVSYATLIQQTTDAMVATRAKLSRCEDLYLKREGSENAVKRCRTLLDEQEKALRALEDTEQNLLSAAYIIG